MSVIVRIPAVWQDATQRMRQVDVPAGALGDVLAALTERCPPLRAKLFDGEGRLHSYVNLFINEEHIRFLGGLSAPLHDGDEIYIVPMVAGG